MIHNENNWDGNIFEVHESHDRQLLVLNRISIKYEESISNSTYYIQHNTGQITFENLVHNIFDLHATIKMN